ncbi:TIR domain-containing protein [Actinomadura chokoriensis]|uniref:TIR domain-containing protein n=1 Tax=Actinomadura chokoriensis TaxID=454156 RepID=A0ABV4R3S0_9ACTN
MRYDAFISYSHEADIETAKALQHELRVIARPWYRPYALRVFRDTTSLPADPSLWSAIERSLERSEYLILLASSKAAASPWVAREVTWWRDNRTSETLLLALTDGDIDWDEDASDFDWARTTALPRCLSGWLPDEPNFVDLRWARDGREGPAGDRRFRNDAAGLSAAVHGVGKDEIEGVERRQRRLFRRVAASVLSVSCVLLVGALVAATLAVGATRRARDQQGRAAARALVAAAEAARNAAPPDVDTALRLTTAAYAALPGPETQAALIQTLAGTSLATVLPVRFRAVSGIAVASDDRILAVADGYSVHLWSLPEGRRPLPVGRIPSPGLFVDELALSPDGRFLAAGGDGVLRLWDIAVPARPVPIALPEVEIAPVSGLAFSADSRILTTCYGSRLVLWDVTRRRTAASITSASGDPVMSVAFADASPTMAVGYRSGLSSTWDVRTPAKPHRVAGPWAASRGAIMQLAMSRDGAVVAASGMDGTSVFGVAKNTVRRLKHFKRPTGAFWTTRASVFPPQGGSLITAIGQSVVRSELVPGGPPRVTERLTVAHSGDIDHAALSPRGDLLVTAGRAGQVILWDMIAPHRPRNTGIALGGFPTEVSEAVLSGKTALAAVAGGDTVRLWDTSARPLSSRSIRRPGQAVEAMALSPDGRTLAVGTGDPAATLWDVEDPDRPKLLTDALTDYTNAPHAMAFSPDGRLLAIAGYPAVTLWDVTKPDRPRRLGRVPAGQTTTTADLAFSPDGRTIAAALGSEVALYDVGDVSRPVARLRGQVESARVAFSPDGRTLATAGQEPGVLLWDLADRTRPRPLGQPLAGPRQYVQRLAFSPDGRTLAVAAGSVRLWDMTDRRRPRSLGDPLPAAGQALTFSRDGLTLAAGGAGHAAVLWDLRGLSRLRADPLRWACQRVSAPLDPATWARYAPGVPYRDGCRT